MKYAIAAVLSMALLSGCAVNVITVNVADSVLINDDNATSANNTINESNVANRKEG